MKKSNLTRRDLIKASTAAALTPYASMLHGASEPVVKPKTIQFAFYNSLMQTYLFDSRPMEFTAAGHVHNQMFNVNFRNRANRTSDYMFQSPEPIVGSNGNSAYIHPIAKPLFDAHFDDFSIVNGVFMKKQSDSHNDCFREGVQKGGRYFIHSHKDYESNGLVQFSQFGIQFAGDVYETTPDGVQKYLQTIRSQPFLSSRSALGRWLRRDMEEMADHYYRGMIGAEALLDQMSNANDEIDLPGIPRSNFSDVNLQELLSMIQAVFQFGLGQHILITLSEPTMDSHEQNRALQVPELYVRVADFIDGVLTFMKLVTDFDDPSKKLMDTTTLIVSSEFNRTQRSTRSNVFAAGSDHNAYGNSFLLAGGGIQGGKIIGRTDGQKLSGQPRVRDPNADEFGVLSSTEVPVLNEKLRDAAPSIDPGRRRALGEPYDFENDEIANFTSYEMQKFITVRSVQNTVLRTMGSRGGFLKIDDEDGRPDAPIIKAIAKEPIT